MLIYYISNKAIDQLYRQHFGSVEEATYTDTEERSSKFNIKLLLDKLISLVTGTNLEVQGELQRKKGETTARKIIETSEDRALILLEEIFSKCPALDPQQLIPNEATEGFYSFFLPIKVAYKKVQGQKGKNLIEVSHKSQNLTVVGLTSDDNWLSPSITNNLIWQSVKNKDTGISASGILSIISADYSKKPAEITAQFLVISQADHLRSLIK